MVHYWASQRTNLIQKCFSFWFRNNLRPEWRVKTDRNKNLYREAYICFNLIQFAWQTLIFCLTKTHYPSCLTLWRTWSCWRRKINQRCDQNFKKLKITSKRDYIWLSVPQRARQFTKCNYQGDGEETDAPTNSLTIQKS